MAQSAVEGRPRVPGGRKKSTSADELSADEEDDASAIGFGPASAKLNPQHRQTSQSLPRFAPDPRSLGTLPSDFNKSYTLDRKKNQKLRGLRSFGSFMHRMAKHVSQVSLHTPSTKFGKKKSLPITPDLVSTSNATNSVHGAGEDKPPQYKQNNLHFDKSKTPGVVGIRNHGNTCFMNAVLQCLSHTELLVEYFVTDQYKNDIKRNNKHNAKKYGTKGELTEHLAMLLKSLWTCQYTAELSSDFKNVVGKFGSQYRGCTQHDAQEFLMWLLDKVHEDLNIATKKKYRPNKSSVGRSDDIVAAEALANHMRCNNSFIYDLFQALYRSSLTCPNCHRQSNTFDPFLSVSLPIPQRVKRPAYVTVAYLDAQPRQVRIGLLLNQTDTVAELRHTLANDTNIPEKQLILTEIYYDGFHRTFHDSMPLSDIHETDNIYAIETPVVSDATASTSALLVVLNKQIAGTQAKRFGGPIVLQVARDSGFLDLQNTILDHMTSMLRDGIIAQKMGVLFKLRIVDGLTSKTYLPHDVDHPLFMTAVDRALTACVPGGGPPHIKLLVEWDQQTMQCMIAQSTEVTEEHSSVRQVSLAYQQPMLSTLDECFQLYTQEEKLGAENAWHCPNCKKRQQGTTKSLSLWSLPDVLVIHLKRFKQIGMRRTKLNTLITFPVNGLDTSIHVTKRNLASPNNKTATGWSPWRPNRRAPTTKDDYLYDLYAVCNHYGNMQGGHYTAFCKNPADNNRWYTFDDTKVTQLYEEEDVVTRAAYLLFYVRRSLPANPPSEPGHWIHQLPNVHMQLPRNMPTSRSHEDLIEDDGEDDSPMMDSATNRTVAVYATMRPTSRTRSHTAPPTPDRMLNNPLSDPPAPRMAPEAKTTTPKVKNVNMLANSPVNSSSDKCSLSSSKTSSSVNITADSVSSSLSGTPVHTSNPNTKPQNNLKGFGELVSRSNVNTADTRRRSATDPSDASPKRDSDTKSSNYEYSRTAFMQESCV